MNKQLLNELQVQAGGAHYPTINPDMQESFARMLVDECIKAVRATPTHRAFTTFDLGIVQGSIEDCEKSIRRHFDL